MLNRLSLHKESNRKRSLGSMEQGHRAGILCSPAGPVGGLWDSSLGLSQAETELRSTLGMHELSDSIS